MTENERRIYPGPLSAESVKIYFYGQSFKQVVAVHFESPFIPYNVITNNSELEWRRKQKNFVRRWLVHSPDHSFQ